MRISINYLPLDNSVTMLCQGAALAQKKDTLRAEYIPDRALAPTIVMPVVRLSDFQQQKDYGVVNATLTNIAWYRLQWDPLAGRYPDPSSENRITSGGNFIIDSSATERRGALTIRQNIAIESPVRLVFTATAIDPREGQLPATAAANIAAEVTLSTTAEVESTVSLRAVYPQGSYLFPLQGEKSKDLNAPLYINGTQVDSVARWWQRKRGTAFEMIAEGQDAFTGTNSDTLHAPAEAVGEHLQIRCLAEILPTREHNLLHTSGAFAPDRGIAPWTGNKPLTPISIVTDDGTECLQLKSAHTADTPLRYCYATQMLTRPITSPYWIRVEYKGRLTIQQIVTHDKNGTSLGGNGNSAIRIIQGTLPEQQHFGVQLVRAVPIPNDGNSSYDPRGITAIMLSLVNALADETVLIRSIMLCTGDVAPAAWHESIADGYRPVAPSDNAKSVDFTLATRYPTWDRSREVSLSLGGTPVSSSLPVGTRMVEAAFTPTTNEGTIPEPEQYWSVVWRTGVAGQGAEIARGTRALIPLEAGTASFAPVVTRGLNAAQYCLAPDGIDDALKTTGSAPVLDAADPGDTSTVEVDFIYLGELKPTSYPFYCGAAGIGMMLNGDSVVIGTTTRYRRMKLAPGTFRTGTMYRLRVTFSRDLTIFTLDINGIEQALEHIAVESPSNTGNFVSLYKNSGPVTAEMAFSRIAIFGRNSALLHLYDFRGESPESRLADKNADGTLRLTAALPLSPINVAKPNLIFKTL